MNNFSATNGTAWVDIVESPEFQRGWTEIVQGKPFDDSFIDDRPYTQDAQMRYERGRQVAVCYKTLYGSIRARDVEEEVWAIADLYQQLRISGTLCGSFGIIRQK